MSNEIQFLLYNLPDKEGRVQVVIKDETIWCTQKAMAELFGIDKSGISRHIANIFKEEELQQDTTGGCKNCNRRKSRHKRRG